MPTTKNKKVAVLENYVINPKTGRLVKIHSKLYYQLVKDRFLDIDFSTRKNSTIYKGENAKDVVHGIVKPEGPLILRADNNSVTLRRRTMSTKEIVDNVVTVSTDILKNHATEFPDDITDEEMDAKIKNLINQGLVGQVAENGIL